MMKIGQIKHLLFAVLFFIVGVLCGYLLSDFASQDSKISEWWQQQREMAGKLLK